MSTISEVRPDVEQPELPKDWASADAVKAQLEKANFKNVHSEQVHTTMKFEKLEPLVDFMLTKMPHIIKLTENFSEDEFKRLKALWTEKAKDVCSSEPGELNGIALIAAGTK